MIGFRNLYKTSLTGQQVADGGVKGVLENCFYRPAASKNYSSEDDASGIIIPVRMSVGIIIPVRIYFLEIIPVRM